MLCEGYGCGYVGGTARRLLNRTMLPHRRPWRRYALYWVTFKLFTKLDARKYKLPYHAVVQISLKIAASERFVASKTSRSSEFIKSYRQLLELSAKCAVFSQSHNGKHIPLRNSQTRMQIRVTSFPNAMVSFSSKDTFAVKRWGRSDR